MTPSAPVRTMTPSRKFILGEPMKPATNSGRRMLVELVGGAELHDPPAIEDGDAVGQRHRLDLVVGHVDGGRLQPLVQPRELVAHPDPKLRVEVRQRLVEQEDGRLANDRAADGDALALAAREHFRAPVEQMARSRAAAAALSTAAATAALLSPASRRPNAMFSRTVMCG